MGWDCTRNTKARRREELAKVSGIRVRGGTASAIIDRRRASSAPDEKAYV
jgi:hypothetical protein